MWERGVDVTTENEDGGVYSEDGSGVGEGSVSECGILVGKI